MGGLREGDGGGGGEGRSWKWAVPSVLRAVKGEPDGVRLVDYLVIRPRKSEGVGGVGVGVGMGETQGKGGQREGGGGVREVVTEGGSEGEPKVRVKERVKEKGGGEKGRSTVRRLSE